MISLDTYLGLVTEQVGIFIMANSFPHSTEEAEVSLD